jgi:hypothetical protein
MSFSCYIFAKFCFVSGLGISFHRYFNFWRVQSALRGSRYELVSARYSLVLSTFCCQWLIVETVKVLNLWSWSVHYVQYCRNISYFVALSVHVAVSCRLDVSL